jgi:hypothetical protein
MRLAITVITGVFSGMRIKFLRKALPMWMQTSLRCFRFHLIAGKCRAESFLDKSEIVLTPAIVKKYFGDADPIGKTILIDDEGEKSFTVTGVIEPAPANSSLHYDISDSAGKQKLLRTQS